jgi:hypothetical protein
VTPASSAPSMTCANRTVQVQLRVRPTYIPRRAASDRGVPDCPPDRPEPDGARRRQPGSAAGHPGGGSVAFCSTTWPKWSSVPSHATAPACRNHPRNPIPAPGAGHPATPGSNPGRTDPGPARRYPHRAGPRADHHRDQPHLTAGTQDPAQLRHRRHGRPPDLRPRLTRPGLLGPHQAYLRQRRDKGCHSTEKLHQELGPATSPTTTGRAREDHHPLRGTGRHPRPGPQAHPARRLTHHHSPAASGTARRPEEAGCEMAGAPSWRAAP